VPALRAPPKMEPPTPALKAFYATIAARCDARINAGCAAFSPDARFVGDHVCLLKMFHQRRHYGRATGQPSNTRNRPAVNKHTTEVFSIKYVGLDVHEETIAAGRESFRTKSTHCMRS
jgi:hypothetical protein